MVAVRLWVENGVMADFDRRSAALRIVLRRYRRQLWREKATALPGLILPGVGSVFYRFIPPLVVAHLLGGVIENEQMSWSTVAPWVLLFGASVLIGEVFWRFAIAGLIVAESRSLEALYVEGMDELLARDLNFFHDNFAGSLTKKVIAYAKSFEMVVDTLAFSVLSNILPLLFVIPVLWSFSPWLVLFLFGMLTVTAASVIPLIRRRKKLVDERETASNVVAGHVADCLANIDAVRVFAQEESEAAIHRANAHDFATKAGRSWRYQNMRVDMVTAPYYALTNTVGVVIAAMIGRNSALGFEAVFITFTYFVNCTEIVWQFNDIYRNIESALSEAAQFGDVLLDEPTVLDPVAPIALAPVDSSVEFRSVRFAHGRSGDALFDDFDLRIEAGERVGLVGRSGGGKTTLTKLLLRLMDIDEGMILVGGQDISSLRQADLRGQMAYVPQDPVMFHRSLRDNLAFGRPDASMADIEAAAAAAHAAEFIEQLPDGYDTLVGERGIKLSGGQRQRVAIARALLRHAPILLLDEATSSLDSESEALIQPALLALMEKRTAIVIAHRLSTVQHMDRLLVLDDGRVVEQGTHRELVRRNGVYASLWAHQSGGFLVADDEAAVA